MWAIADGTRRNAEDGDQMQRQRRLGRTPRVPFYRWQVTLLEQQYQRHNYLSTTAISELAAMLQLSYNRVKIWFQNRRAKERRKEEIKRIQQEGNDYNRSMSTVHHQPPVTEQCLTDSEYKHIASAV
ncbi:homeobox protein H17-like [Schistocerca nitens]|uniref:homeobox protein H17-like n=1 Tax=Schistocerca nitens TaxID=7011 RepID=UPI0021183253|nr:homeobox protein H17-like [Schistocerca nitens]